MMSYKLNARPFCGGHPSIDVERKRVGYGSYEEEERYFVVNCIKCNLKMSQHVKHFINCFEHTVKDYRNNPALRAKCEDQYNEYEERVRDLLIKRWNTNRGRDDD